jgi:hypothetical protein
VLINKGLAGRSCVGERNISVFGYIRSQEVWEAVWVILRGILFGIGHVVVLRVDLKLELRGAGNNLVNEVVCVEAAPLALTDLIDIVDAVTFS